MHRTEPPVVLPAASSAVSPAPTPASSWEAPPADNRTRLLAGASVFVAGVVGWLVHFTAPRDEIDDDQLKPIGYVYDIVQRGRYFSPTDFEDVVASKPPFYPWVVSLLSAITGRIEPIEFYLVTGVAIIGSGMLCWWWARTRFGEAAGVGAGLAMVLSTLTIKHACLARTDALFTFAVCAAAMVAYHAWRQGTSDPARTTRTWTLFYLLAAVVTLTKGPLGVLLAVGGLLAALWEWRQGRRWPIRGSHGWGLSLFLLLTGGWFVGAVITGGQEVVDIVIGRELVGHATRSDGGEFPFSKFYQPSFYFITRYVPWSIPAVIAFWRVVRRPSPGDEARLGERFLFCWFMLGLFIFSAAPHQRGDLLLPLIPAAAILAGREAAIWTRRLPRAARIGVAGVVSVAILAGCAAWHHKGRLRDRDVVETHAALALADEVVEVVRSRGARLEFLEEAWEVQFAFRTKQPVIDTDVAELLLAGDAPVVIITRIEDEIDAAMRAAGGRRIAFQEAGVREPMAAYANFDP
jgi:4-amino-4-deoxy-L-arabinose transferase-like glycosyltransferase